MFGLAVSMPSSGKNDEEEDEVFHVGMELALSVCGVLDLGLPEVITKARVVAATDSSSGEDDDSSVSNIARKKKKRSAGARWVLPFANHSIVSDCLLRFRNTWSRYEDIEHFAISS